MLEQRKTGIGQTEDFFKRDNPWFWALIGGGLFLTYQLWPKSGGPGKAPARIYTGGTRSRRRKGNPRLPFELPVGKDSIPKRRRRLNPRATPQGPCLMGIPSSMRVENPDNLFSRGNPKIGKLWNFSLPAGDTCPGRSTWCRDHCYAQKGHFEFGVVKAAYKRNYQRTLKPSFVEDAIAELRPKKDKYIRVHVSGDFYSPAYVYKWIAIAKALPNFKFYAYTRTWRVPEIKAAIEKLRRQPNFEVMASTDPATGIGPAGWREAGIERNYRPGGIVCRAQTEGITCRQCLYCWDGAEGVAFHTH